MSLKSQLGGVSSKSSRWKAAGVCPVVLQAELWGCRGAPAAGMEQLEVLEDDYSPHQVKVLRRCKMANPIQTDGCRWRSALLSLCVDALLHEEELNKRKEEEHAKVLQLKGEERRLQQAKDQLEHALRSTDVELELYVAAAAHHKHIAKAVKGEEATAKQQADTAKQKLTSLANAILQHR